MIELYDGKSPYNNFLTCALLRPDRLILLVSGESGNLSVWQEQFENFRFTFRLKTEAVIEECGPDDPAETAGKLRQAIREYGQENVVIDTIGGNETLLLAAGGCAAEYPEIRVAGIRGCSPVWIAGKTAGAPVTGEEPELSVRELIAIAAGEFKECARFDRRKISDPVMEKIPSIFEIFLKYRAEWPDFTAYLQKLCVETYNAGPGVFRGPSEFMINPRLGRKARPNLPVIKALHDAGIIRRYFFDRNEFALFFADPEIPEYLREGGAWVELFVYYVMAESGIFSDVEIDAVLSWDNDADEDDTVNEVDVLAVRGVIPVFVSCKAGVPNVSALNEILAITNRFGSSRAKAVLVTASLPETEAPAILKRAAESGICLIGRDKLSAEEIRKCFEDLLP